MNPILNPDGTWYGIDLSDAIPEEEKQIVQDWLITGKYPAFMGGQGFQLPLNGYAERSPNMRMFVKEIVLEQDNGPTLIATGLLANTVSRGRLFDKGHIVSWGIDEVPQEKILYYTGVDHTRKTHIHPNVGTVGHCDWNPYNRVEWLYELTPLQRAIRDINHGKS